VAPTDVTYDAIIVGSGMGGLATAAQMVSQGAKVLVLEKYVIPGGSAGWYEREGYTFDVGSSMMFGFGDQDGSTNLLTRALAAVGKKLETIHDPVQIHYHLPDNGGARPGGLDIKVTRNYTEYLAKLCSKWPHEAPGIRRFYNACWEVFDALNAIELKSLEEPRYLLEQFVKEPFHCLNLAWYVAVNSGDLARKWIKDEELLRFIDMECYAWSTVDACKTPFINAGMVFCDRHYGGINYPRGGVGRIPRAMADGITERGGRIEFKANVKEIITEGEGESMRAVGVRLVDGREYRARAVVSNATRWDTFEGMLGEEKMPESEKLFRQRYTKAPSFLTVHMGVEADALPEGTHCHHILLEDWSKMYDSRGTVFLSIPSTLDPSVAPPGKHLVHAFTPDWIDNWSTLSAEEYQRQKDRVSQELIDRLAAIFPDIRGKIDFVEVGTPRTHRKFLNRSDGTYGPIPSRRPLGMLSMPFNRTSVQGLYCVGDSTFPGQGVNAVVFSGFGCAHRVLVDLGMVEGLPKLGETDLDAQYNQMLARLRDSS